MDQQGCQGVSVGVESGPRVGEAMRASMQGCDDSKRRFVTHRALDNINILRIMKDRCLLIRERSHDMKRKIPRIN